MQLLTMSALSVFRDVVIFFFFFSSRRRHTRCSRDWSSDVCSSDLQLLLCSDGLTGMITEEQIQAILGATEGAPQEAADRLVTAANHAGGVDNITVVVLDVLPDDGADEGAAGTAAPRAATTQAEEEPV